MTIYKLVVIGPNLPTQTETFHVHLADCQDRRRPIYAARSHQADWSRAWSYESRRDVVEDIYADIIGENETYQGEDGWRLLVDDFKWFPCTGDLPVTR